MVQCFSLSHSWVILAVCFESLLTCNWDQAFWHWPARFSLESLVLGFHCTLHRFHALCVRCSKAAPEHYRASSMFQSRDCYFLDMLHFSVCQHRADVPLHMLPLCHLSVEHSHSCVVACQRVVGQISVWFFMTYFQQWSSSSFKKVFWALF